LVLTLALFRGLVKPQLHSLSGWAFCCKSCVRSTRRK